VGAFLFILPILAFDIWLALTTGRRQWQKWRESRNWRQVALAALAGVLLAILCAFVIQYKDGPQLHLKGFPVPFDFAYLEDKRWVASSSPSLIRMCARCTDVITGLIAPLIPCKIAEFLRVVKKELN